MSNQSDVRLMPTTFDAPDFQQNGLVLAVGVRSHGSDGQGAEVRARVDTGQMTSLIDVGMAKRVGISKSYTVQSDAGPRDVYIVDIAFPNTLQFGGVHHVAATLPSGIGLILGRDVLSKFRLVLEGPALRWTLEPVVDALTVMAPTEIEPNGDAAADADDGDGALDDAGPFRADGGLDGGSRADVTPLGAA